VVARKDNHLLRFNLLFHMVLRTVLAWMAVYKTAVQHDMRTFEQGKCIFLLVIQDLGRIFPFN
jgi:hypothetical protein